MPKRGFECCDASRKRLILDARLLGHLAHGFKIFARHDIHIAQELLGLSPNKRFRLPPDALCRARGFVMSLAKSSNILFVVCVIIGPKSKARANYGHCELGLQESEYTRRRSHLALLDINSAFPNNLGGPIREGPVPHIVEHR